MALRRSEWPNIFDSLSIKCDNTNDISNNNDSTEVYHNTTELILCNHKLIKLSDKFCQYFDNLVKLNLSDNNIRDLPPSISLLKKLEHFIVDKNNIQQLPDEITTLEVLKEFSISKNCLSTLPPHMEKLKKLQILNLSDNKLQSLPNSWITMNLIALDISKNLFKLIPHCLREGMLKVETLNVSENKHMNINATIFSKNLRKFYAKNNGAIDTSFPQWILSGKFSEMDELEFEGTQFKSINIPISQRKMSLKRLNLKNCKLYDTVLAKILANLSSLEYLDIGNGFYVPARNSFSILPDGYINDPEILIEMNVSNSELADISTSIGTFMNLTKINLHGNSLSWLPEEICNLNKVQVLDISSNIMIMLPQNLGSMTSLQILEAANNHISSLPSSITNLKNLFWMDLFGNDFAKMPEEIVTLENLTALDLELNNFVTNDIVQPINYLNLRNRLRMDKPNRSTGPQIIDTDSEPTSSHKSWIEESNFSNDVESIQEESNNVNASVEEENWDITDDFMDEFDPFNPPPISPPKWETPYFFFENRFNFCPADLHAQRIKDIIAQARANGQCPLPLPVVEESESRPWFCLVLGPLVGQVLFVLRKRKENH